MSKAKEILERARKRYSGRMGLDDQQMRGADLYASVGEALAALDAEEGE